MSDTANSLNRYAHICGWGTAVPDNILTNAELSRMVDTTDDWIVNRTGIKQRYIANDKETTASLGVKAAKSALDTANISPNVLD